MSNNKQVVQPIVIKKLQSHLDEFNRVEYILFSASIGKKMKLSLTGKKICLHCDKETTKIFGEGSCYHCFITLPCNDICIVQPHKCHFDKGTCRDSDWGNLHCNQAHIVYLSLTSNVKVGITRLKNIPYRWIDQGAKKALPIIQTASRFHAGLIENALSKYIADKTHWIKMLSMHIEDQNLIEKREILFDECGEVLDTLLSLPGCKILEDEQELNLEYPITQIPTPVKALDWEKLQTIEDTLLGIKGQYLVFKQGVLNWRKYSGLQACIEIQQ